MTSLRIRPRFKHHAKASPDAVKKAIQERLDAENAPVVGRMMRSYITIRIPLETRHFWSPQLSISLEEHEEEGTIVRGLYGPLPTIWAFFTYGYGALGIAALFIAVVGLSELALEKSGMILWWLPIIAGAGLVLYLIAQTGQKLGVEETFTLHHFYEDAVRDKVHIE